MKKHYLTSFFLVCLHTKDHVYILVWHYSGFSRFIFCKSNKKSISNDIKRTLSSIPSYVGIMNSWSVLCLFLTLITVKNFKPIFFKRKEEGQLYHYFILALVVGNFVITLFLILWNTSKLLKTQNTLTVTYHQSTEAWSVIR